jgi:hypothetical protein
MLAALIGAAVVVGLIVLGLSTEDDGKKDTASATETETQARTQTEQTRAKKKPAPAATPTRVALRLAPVAPTYACVDRGTGTDVIFEGTLDAPRTFRGTRLRVNLGKTAVDVRANGKPVAIPPGPDPVGYEFTPGSSEPIPLGERPCA